MYINNQLLHIYILYIYLYIYTFKVHCRQADKGRAFPLDFRHLNMDDKLIKSVINLRLLNLYMTISSYIWVASTTYKQL